jgi:phosphate starvation-inducible protein PhoH
VRHKLVGKIVDAYERFDSATAQAQARTGSQPPRRRSGR